MGDVGDATSHSATKRCSVRGSSGKPEDPSNSPDGKVASNGGDEVTSRSKESSHVSGGKNYSPPGGKYEELKSVSVRMRGVRVVIIKLRNQISSDASFNDGENK